MAGSLLDSEMAASHLRSIEVNDSHIAALQESAVYKLKSLSRIEQNSWAISIDMGTLQSSFSTIFFLMLATAFLSKMSAVKSSGFMCMFGCLFREETNDTMYLIEYPSLAICAIDRITRSGVGSLSIPTVCMNLSKYLWCDLHWRWVDALTGGTVSVLKSSRIFLKSCLIAKAGLGGLVPIFPL